MPSIEFKNQLKEYLIYCNNCYNNSLYKDEKEFYRKAAALTQKQLELAEAGWDEIDIAKISYICSENSLKLAKNSKYYGEISSFCSNFKQ